MSLGLGYWEIALIMVVALIVIGPKKLPQLMRDIGRVLGYLRRTSDELRRELLFSDEIREFKRSLRDVTDPTKPAKPPKPPPVPPKLKLKPQEEIKSEAAGAVASDAAALDPPAVSAPPAPAPAPEDGPHDR